jgi:hypothetical protein
MRKEQPMSHGQSVNLTLKFPKAVPTALGPPIIFALPGDAVLQPIADQAARHVQAALDSLAAT